MKLLSTLLLLIASISLLSAQGEHELIIEPGPPGTLDQTIIGDTTSTGERADPDRVYILRRGTPYLTSQRIRWGDYHIRIKSEEGDGPRPMIIFSPDVGGEGIGQVLRLNSGAHLTLDGIHLQCRDLVGNFSDNAIRIGGENARITINNCVVEEADQAGLRLDAVGLKVYITNSIFNRMGLPTNPNNGRFLDNRGHPMDTIWVENCVIYDVTSRIYRHSGAGHINYGRFNQNTFWGVGQHGISLSPSNNLMFTNNIVANPVFLGYEKSMPEYAITIDTFVSGEDNINVSFNNFFVDDDHVGALPDTNFLGDTILPVTNTMFGPNISNAIMETASATTNISELLAFSDAPNLPSQFINANHNDTLVDDILADAGEWDFSDLSPDDTYSGLGLGDIERFTTWHNFSYPEGAVSYTAGSEGQKLGADLSNIDTDIEEDYFISNNLLYYPNPVSDELFIQNLDQSALKTVGIYDLSGLLLRQQKVDAIYTRFQLGDLPKGTYVLTVRDQSGKVSSRKIVKH
ncbi:MAG: T9SS type A sorting domain-containing protein [Saprospiraceae bacterium]|nr:T9SS type A sorting domain-containing protein [Saprospiraceae bacterium]